jgi:acetoin utilization deacetylase AcuC-like enzyme
MKRTGFIYHPLYQKHETDPHPENPGRLQAILDRLENSEIPLHITKVDPREALHEEIASIHNSGYISSVEQRCREGQTSLDMDTNISLNSYDAAILASGAGLTAVDKVIDGELRNVFCAVRPPGHHAEHERSMGFCLFNNVAVATRYAQQKRGLDRIAIFDWDVHHGNGTQNSFYSDSSVFYSSSHQFPFYPGTGDKNETGTGDGLGATLNFPLKAYSGDEDYLSLIENKLIPEFIKFKPDLIFISAGFDAHAEDPLATMQVSSECFGKMTTLIRKCAEEICNGRLISMLEGGYNHQALSESVYNHLEALSA